MEAGLEIPEMVRQDYMQRLLSYKGKRPVKVAMASVAARSGVDSSAMLRWGTFGNDSADGGADTRGVRLCVLARTGVF